MRVWVQTRPTLIGDINPNLVGPSAVVPPRHCITHTSGGSAGPAEERPEALRSGLGCRGDQGGSSWATTPGSPVPPGEAWVHLVI